MSARRIVLWRHGQTEYNASGRLQGQSDIELNDTGRAQAAAAAPRIAALGPTQIISSDLGRALGTAAALGELTDLPVEPDHRLRERSFGRWEGLTQQQIQAGWPTAYREWRQGREPQGIGADRRQDVAQRMATAARGTAAALPDGGLLVVVSHGAAITLGLTQLLDLDPESWFGLNGLENCRWAVLDPNPGRRPVWRLSGHNLGG